MLFTIPLMAFDLLRKCFIKNLVPLKVDTDFFETLLAIIGIHNPIWSKNP